MRQRNSVNLPAWAWGLAGVLLLGGLVAVTVSFFPDYCRYQRLRQM